MSPTDRFSRRVALPFSEHQAIPNARHMGKAAADRQIRVSVILQRKMPLDVDSLNGRQMSRQDLNDQYGASQSAFDTVCEFARAHGLTIDDKASSLERRRVELHGPVSAFNAAFGVELNNYEPELSGSTTQKPPSFHAFTGHVTIPEELVPSVEAVLGLDNRPIATPKFRYRKDSIIASPAASTSGTFTPPQVAQVYKFPQPPSGTLAGAGQTIAIIELGGGYTTTDITNYFKSLGLTSPNVTAVLLDGGTNTPGDPNGADGEVMLDIEVAGAVAPGAKIVVYFTTNTDQGFQDAISTAIHDSTNDPSVISISWGGPESSWSQTAVHSMDTTCQSAAALGISITVASGDNGSTDGATGNTVDFPASSPHVLACGGTALTASNGTRKSEVVWNDQSNGGGATGGGVSKLFTLPTWQANAGVPAPASSKGGRGVPDVAGDAAPGTGYQTLVDGQQEVVGGTSAVAPLWAGLIALLNQQLGAKVGFLNPKLYPLAHSAFFDVTSGSNGAFNAGPGWDACTGLGTPDGQALLTALKSA